MAFKVHSIDPWHVEIRSGRDVPIARIEWLQGTPAWLRLAVDRLPMLLAMLRPLHEPEDAGQSG